MSEPTRHPLIWDEISVCRDHGIKCQIDMAIEEALRELREEVEGTGKALVHLAYESKNARIRQGVQMGGNLVRDAVLAAIDRRLAE